MRALLLIILASLIVPAHAQLYRHVGPDGRITYTDRPPAPEAADAVSVDAPPSTQRQDARRLEQQMRDAERRHHDRRHREQQYLERSRREGEAYREEQAEQQRIDDARRSGEVVPGMTADQARRLWGNPDRVNASNYRGQEREQWVYNRNPRRFGASNYSPHGADYVYVRDGMVTSVQRRARIR